MFTKMRQTILIVCIAFYALLATTSSVSAAGGGGGGFDDDDVYVAGYYYIPGTGAWGVVDTGIPEDPNEYKFEYKCWTEDAGDIACLAESEGKCTAGEKGRLVYWFFRLKGSGEQWSPMEPHLSCIYAEKPEDIGDQIRESILREFQSQPIQSGRLELQPSPHTLVGAHTNLYVSAGEQVFDFVLFEQDIRIVARPTEYEWNYGDGTTYGPASFAGTSLPESRWGEETPTSHVYRATGDFQASVVVYFSGEYSINGGPMVPIDGRATVPSAPQTVSVWKSESRNVADDCLVNPAGFGC